MRTVAYILCLILIAVTIKAWDYKDLEEWEKEYLYCGGLQQSPINIDVPTSGRKYFPSILFKEYPAMYNISNNGHTIKVEYNGVGQLSGVHEDTRELYLITQFHFHWGLEDHVGSEHSINGKFMPMELHVVAYNSKYPSFEVAQHNRNGLAVLAFLFKLVPEKNEGLKTIINAFPMLKERGKKYPLPNFHLSDLIPLKLDNFFRYAGSLTTPPCYENVQWSVFEHALGIEQSQLQAFRQLTTLDGDDKETIAPNYRPTQRLNKRYIMQNVQA